MSKTSMKGPPVWKVRIYVMTSAYDNITWTEAKAIQAVCDAKVAMSLGAGSIQRIEMIRGGSVVEVHEWNPRTLAKPQAVALPKRPDGVTECPPAVAYGALMWGGNTTQSLTGGAKPQAARETSQSLDDLGL